MFLRGEEGDRFSAGRMGRRSGGCAAARTAARLVTLNIGINCQWRQRCIDQQQHAMRRALFYVRTQRPANWKIQLCNRNAARGRYRVDWIGFDNCIRNAALRIPKRMS